MLDLEPATRVLTDLLHGVRDDQLGAPTPCAQACLGDLIDHVDGLSIAFTAAATKTPPPAGGPGAPPDAARLEADWRTQILERLAGLAAAWRAQAAWTGVTNVGGQDLPGEVAAVIALDEVVVHGWDIAVASRQSFRCEPQLVEAAYRFVRSTVADKPQGIAGLFGPLVPVPGDAPLLDRLLGLTGRNPDWKAGAHV